MPATTSPAEVKVCASCRVAKPVTDYGTDRSTRDNLLSRCRDCYNAQRRTYTAQRRDSVRDYQATWRDANPEKVRATAARYRARNRPRRLEDALRRRSERAGLEVRWISDRDLATLLRQPCAACGDNGPREIDHIVPIRRGGRHAIGNLQMLCTSCNRSKGARLLIEWRAIPQHVRDAHRVIDQWRASRR